MDLNKEILNKVQDVLTSATDEDKRVLTQVLNGLQSKHNGEYKTYITSFMKTSIQESGEQLEMSIPITPFLSNSVDIVHGGFTATLADTAMGTLVNRRIPENLVAVTSEMKLNYIAPGVGEALRCEATILHLGSKTSVTECKIYNDVGTLVAAASGSFYLIPR
ncbi:PaaI family thioesterase [Pseudalkalibacillus sp. Hm43]|uniref:PaaI family thioesterase n=1 Tax=Pseudalkalibacillus sp. Hm43 TaxID=3450742 RepID=UPI003F4208AB